MQLSKLTFNPKEVIYITMAVVAYFGQLTHLSNKIDEYRYKTDLRLQGVEFRISSLEANSVSAILPKKIQLENEPTQSR